MAKMIIDPQTEHHLLEIADPNVEKSEHEITEGEFNIRRIDMGPSTTEGDIYHAKLFVVVLSKRAEVVERKNQELMQYVDALTSFIRSTWSTESFAASSSSGVYIT